MNLYCIRKSPYWLGCVVLNKIAPSGRVPDIPGVPDGGCSRGDSAWLGQPTFGDTTDKTTLSLRTDKQQALSRELPYDILSYNVGGGR